MAETGYQWEKIYAEHHIKVAVLQIARKTFTEKIVLKLIREMVVNGLADVSRSFQPKQHIIAGITAHVVNQYSHNSLLSAPAICYYKHLTDYTQLLFTTGTPE